MDLIEWQAELARQWLGLLGLSAETARNGGLALANAAGSQSSSPRSALSSWSSHSAPSWWWPDDPFQLANAFTPNPFALTLPWMAWPMAQLPWGTTPWGGPFSTMPFMPWSLGAGVWPFGGLGSSSTLFGTPSAWGLPGFGHAAPFLGWPHAAPTTTDVLEQVAAAYRTAGGHAVAIVLGPIAASPEPGAYGQPWWQAPARYASF